MSANRAAVQIDAVYHKVIEVTGANTNFTAPTSTVLLNTAGTNGTVIIGIEASCVISPTVADTIDLFISNDGGSTFHYWKSILIPAGTVSATSPPANVSLAMDGVRYLASGEKIYATTRIGQKTEVHGQFGDY